MTITTIYKDNLRFYLNTLTQREYISCTSLLSFYEDKKGLNNWIAKLGEEEAAIQRDLASERGTRAHSFIENHPLNPSEELLTSIDCKFALNAIRGFYSKASPLELEGFVNSR